MERTSSHRADGDAQQTMLPLDVPVMTDRRDAGGGAAASEKDHERPIGFALTARARRAVAPASLPELSVVTARAPGAADGSDGALDEPGDTRPARARALRRAGVPVSEIARQLRTDTLTVAAWVGELAPRGPAAPAQLAGVTGEGAADGVVDDGDPSAAGAAADDAVVGYHLARAAAADAACQRLHGDGAFALGVGILASLAEVDEHAVTLTGGPAELLSRALDLLATAQPEARTRARVIARVGEQVAGDLVRHRTATTMGLDPGQVSWTRRRGVGRPDDVEFLVRIADPDLATTVAGWVDAALDPAPAPLAAWHA